MKASRLVWVNRICPVAVISMRRVFMRVRQDKASRHPAKTQTSMASACTTSGVPGFDIKASCHAVSHNTQVIASVSAHRIREGRTSAEVAIDIRNQRREKSASPSSAMRRCACGQTLAKIRLPFVPPKPNEFFRATLIGISRAALAQ